MQVLGGRRHVFEVEERPPWHQALEHLGVEGPLATVVDMVDGEAGHDGVEEPRLGQWQRQVVVDDLHVGLGSEAPADGGEPGLRR